MPAQSETILYRVAQEALLNAARHAHADSVRVRLSRTSGGVLLTVTDDGAGFSPEQARQRSSEGHFGLIGMPRAHRAERRQLAARLGTGPRHPHHRPSPRSAEPRRTAERDGLRSDRRAGDGNVRHGRALTMRFCRHTKAASEAQRHDGFDAPHADERAPTPDAAAPVVPDASLDGITCRVIVVDDDPLVGARLRELLTDFDHTVLGLASSGIQALVLVKALLPDVVVTDLRMPAMSGIQLTAAVRQLSDPPAVVVVSAYDDDSLMQEAIQAGAAAYVVKGSPGEHVHRAVVQAAAARRHLAPGPQVAP